MSNNNLTNVNFNDIVAKTKMMKKIILIGMLLSITIISPCQKADSVIVEGLKIDKSTFIILCQKIEKEGQNNNLNFTDNEGNAFAISVIANETLIKGLVGIKEAGTFETFFICKQCVYFYPGDDTPVKITENTIREGINTLLRNH